LRGISPGTVASTARLAEFRTAIAEAYVFEREALDLSRGVYEGKVVAAAATRLTDFVASGQGKAVQREVTRGMFGLLRKRL